MTRCARVVLAGSIVFGLAAFARAADPNWSAVEQVLGRAPRVQPDGVRKFSFPRSDLRVVCAGVSVEPALALGSWAAFHATASGAMMAMGDLVLLEGEVNPVVGALQVRGIAISAIHNHLIGEEPHVMYVHFSGSGSGEALASALKSALQKTATPTAATAGSELAPPERANLEKVERALGRKGSFAGRVLQVSVPRAGPVEENGMPIPDSMGIATALNFQPAGDRVAATGDFVLVATEVDPVIRALRSHGVDVTALHSHMLTETPRLFFLHFWGLGTPEEIGAGLKAALDRVATK